MGNEENKATSFKLKDRTKQLLKMIAEKNLRSQANMIEFMVEEFAKKEGIKIDSKGNA